MKELAAAIDELVHGIGVREDLELALPPVLSKKDIPGWVQTVAGSLGLPIQAKVSFISKKRGKPGFGTTAMSRTDGRGRGIDGITAQVGIPHGIPMFGTAGLQGFPIEVRVSENCGKKPTTFVAVMAHELSHVLLHSLRHPQRESELHTDLVPLLLGFRPVVSAGRTHVEHGTQGDVTTTFGYLTDAQFDFATQHVEKLLANARKKHGEVVDLMHRLRAALPSVSRQMTRFNAYRAYVNRHPPQSTKQSDAERLVRFNDVDYTQRWERTATDARAELAPLSGRSSPVSHYTDQVCRRLDQEHDLLSRAVSSVDDTLASLATDVATLRRYLPLRVKLRENRWVAWLFGGRVRLDDLLVGERVATTERPVVKRRAGS